MRRGRDHDNHDNNHAATTTITTRMGATTPDEGTTTLTQHPPCHSEHLLVLGLWVLQWDDKGRGKDRDNNYDHNKDGKGKGTTGGHKGTARGQQWNEGMNPTQNSAMRRREDTPPTAAGGWVPF